MGRKEHSPQLDSPLKLGNCADDVAVPFPLVLALADPVVDAVPLPLDVGVNDKLSPTDAVDDSAGGVNDAAASTRGARCSKSGRRSTVRKRANMAVGGFVGDLQS